MEIELFVCECEKYSILTIMSDVCYSDNPQH